MEQGGRQGKVYGKDCIGHKSWKALALVLLISCGDGEGCSCEWDRGSRACMLELGDNRSWGRLDSHIYGHKMWMVQVQDLLTSCGDGEGCSCGWDRGSSSCMQEQGDNRS